MAYYGITIGWKVKSKCAFTFYSANRYYIVMRKFFSSACFGENVCLILLSRAPSCDAMLDLQTQMVGQQMLWACALMSIQAVLVFARMGSS